MGYFLRFIAGDIHEANLDQIEKVLKSDDDNYSFQRSMFEFEQIAEVYYDSILIGQIEINHAGEDIFEDDIASFRDMIGEGKSDEERSALTVLDNARYMIVAEVLWKGINAETTLEKFDPLWAWLFANRIGILQADNEGFYDANGLIVERNFML